MDHMAVNMAPVIAPVRVIGAQQIMAQTAWKPLWLLEFEEPKVVLLLRSQNSCLKMVQSEEAWRNRTDE